MAKCDSYYRTEGILSTASMWILVNGSPTSPFQLQRGLRQGDPLSPFLFLLVAETFSRLVAKGKEIGALAGVLVGKEQIPVIHLQFADDIIIFAPADRQLLATTKNCSNVLRWCQGSISIIESRCLFHLSVMMIGLRRQFPYWNVKPPNCHSPTWESLWELDRS